jgi:hypothetical protein
MLCTNVFYSKRLTKYYPDYLLYNVVSITHKNSLVHYGKSTAFLKIKVSLFTTLLISPTDFNCCSIVSFAYA